VATKAKGQTKAAPKGPSRLRVEIVEMTAMLNRTGAVTDD
jgi:hypothetical protein